MALFDWLWGRRPELADRSLQHLAPKENHSPPVTRTPSKPAFSHAHRLPEGRFRFIALDVETACSDAASICQIGLACVQPDNQIQTFSMLVNPGTRFDPFNIQLHGISPEHVVDAPRFLDALAVLMPLLTTHHLVQHSNFDKQAMTAACSSCGLTAPDLRWSNSVTIARRAWPELKGNGGHGLASLKRRLNLEFHHHDAGEDARAAALVVLRAEAHLQLSFEDLIKPAVRTGHSPRITMNGSPDGALAGVVVVFTGALRMSRSEAAEIAASVGMTVKPNVTRQTTHVVVGDQDLSVLAGHAKSSKHRKAEEMQSAGHSVQILSERDFMALVSSARRGTTSRS
jgi:DNA polymerase-3 subunit epsilon